MLDAINQTSKYLTIVIGVFIIGVSFTATTNSAIGSASDVNTTIR